MSTQPSECVGFVVRAAAEGVPVAAIARATQLPYDRVMAQLNRAKQLGAITEIPRADWQDNARERPPAGLSTEEIEFLCRQRFRLTNLEAGFLALLLRCLLAKKDMLHAVIELQRNQRIARPDRQEITDPKMVDVMICKLRTKLKAADPALAISTSWGKGYFLHPDVKDRLMRTLRAGARTRTAA